MKRLRRPLILFLSFFILSCARGGTYPVLLRYQSVGEFPTLQQKIGSTLGVAPFKDERPDTLYVGLYAPLAGGVTYLKSEPFPLEKTIKESISQVLSGYGAKVIPISSWDGRPESLKPLEGDSILMTEIKRFWIEGRASLFGTKVKTSVHLVIYLGVKKEGKVFTRNVDVEKEVTVARLTPEQAEQMINQTLSDIFDSFFSNPY